MSKDMKKKLNNLIDDAMSYYYDDSVLGFSETINKIISLVLDYKAEKIKEMIERG